MAGNLEKVQKDINQEIKLKVDQINSLAGEIASLNKQINTIELAGTKANELRDRRTLLIDELSQDRGCGSQGDSDHRCQQREP